MQMQLQVRKQTKISFHLEVPLDAGDGVVQENALTVLWQLDEIIQRGSGRISNVLLLSQLIAWDVVRAVANPSNGVQPGARLQEFRDMLHQQIQELGPRAAME